MLQSLKIFLLLSLPAFAFAEKGSISLDSMIATALQNNSRLTAARASSRAAFEKANGVGYWADPTLSGNLFQEPIETRNGAQRANFSLSQMIPFPGKLSAKQSKARLAAEAQRFSVEYMELAIVRKLKTLFYKSYSLNKQLALKSAETKFLKNLSKIAIARLRGGKTKQQDVLQATLEISRLNEEAKELNFKIKATISEIENLLSSNAKRGFAPPKSITIPKTSIPTHKKWNELLNKIKVFHPRILAAQRELESSKRGVTYSKFKKAPDLKASVSMFQIDESTAMGETPKNADAWAIGAGISIPLWYGKYSSAEREAVEINSSKLAKYKGVIDSHMAELSTAKENLITAREILNIYKTTMIPQAEQVLAANLKAYQQGSVTFDRVLADFRRVLMFKSKFYNSEARVASSVAKFEELTAVSKISSNNKRGQK